MGKAFNAFVLISGLLSVSGWASPADTTRTTKNADPVPAITPAVHAVTAPAPAESFSNSTATEPPTPVETPVEEPRRAPQDIRLVNDTPLLGREYGFGILGSIVTGTLGFFIGSGIETAIYGETAAHKGTLSFTGIRYDNQYGAFWGGASGLLLGSAFTTYFVGETEEEDGGLFPTLIGTAVATGGALAIASWMGVNDGIHWTPFIPLLALPSIGGTLGFNVSRWFHDRKREEVVGKEAVLHVHAPSFGWTPVHGGGDRLMVQALNLTF